MGDLSSQIDAKQAEIEQKQTEIDAKQAEVEAKQQQLGDRMCSAYKSGGSSVLDILLSSATFEELTSNIYYLDKISAADQAMISEVKDLKAELERQKSSLETEKAELESQKSELETLQAQQEQQLEEAQAKQAEAQDLVSNLSSEVKELMAQRDAELLAAQKAAEEAARREEERRKAAAAANKNNGSSGGSSSGGSGSGGSQTITGNGSLAAVQSAAYSVPSPGSGLCAAWVTRVFAAAGLNVGGGNACDMYNWYCYTSVSNIQPGMIVACPSAPYSSAAVIYGHVGIYLGNNTVRDNASGRLRTSSLSAWVSEYSVTSTVRCGWLGGVALS